MQFYFLSCKRMKEELDARLYIVSLTRVKTH